VKSGLGSKFTAGAEVMAPNNSALAHAGQHKPAHAFCCERALRLLSESWKKNIPSKTMAVRIVGAFLLRLVADASDRMAASR
jgi:hypothetical protein